MMAQPMEIRKMQIRFICAFCPKNQPKRMIEFERPMGISTISSLGRKVVSSFAPLTAKKLK